jgi:hypothetical protein
LITKPGSATEAKLRVSVELNASTAGVEKGAPTRHCQTRASRPATLASTLLPVDSCALSRLSFASRTTCSVH